MLKYKKKKRLDSWTVLRDPILRRVTVANDTLPSPPPPSPQYPRWGRELTIALGDKGGITD